LGAQSSTEIFLFERFRLDRRGLFRRNEGDVLTHIEIGSRALDVLGVLLERPGDLVTRDEIMSAAWPTTVVEDNNLTVQISALRRILDQDRADGSCIQTVPGRGYRFIAPVTRVAPAASSVSELPSNNDGGGFPTGNGQSPDPALGRIDGTRRLAMSQMRRRLRVSIITLVIGVPVLVAAITAANWRSL
jgi:DNA-binding winged helix-turn-helix (wHTH) protein